MLMCLSDFGIAGDVTTIDGFALGTVSYDLSVAGGCGQCPGTGFQKVGAYAQVYSIPVTSMPTPMPSVAGSPTGPK